MKCKDMGIDCDFEAQGNSVEEILEKTIAHARSVNKPNHDRALKFNQEYLKVWGNSEEDILVTETDQAMIERLIQFEAASENLSRLEKELDRAVVVNPVDIPPDVVTIDSHVRFEDMISGKESVVFLVLPSRADASAGRISVFAPVGSALLGLSVGQSIEWPLPSGRRMVIHVKEVLYQPESALAGNEGLKTFEKNFLKATTGDLG
jgi:regulator of nucleoside diphosphate kinase